MRARSRSGSLVAQGAIGGTVNFAGEAIFWINDSSAVGNCDSLPGSFKVTGRMDEQLASFGYHLVSRGRSALEPNWARYSGSVYVYNVITLDITQYNISGHVVCGTGRAFFDNSPYNMP